MKIVTKDKLERALTGMWDKVKTTTSPAIIDFDNIDEIDSLYYPEYKDYGTSILKHKEQCYKPEQLDVIDIDFTQWDSYGICTFEDLVKKFNEYGVIIDESKLEDIFEVESDSFVKNNKGLRVNYSAGTDGARFAFDFMGTSDRSLLVVRRMQCDIMFDSRQSDHMWFVSYANRVNGSELEVYNDAIYDDDTITCEYDSPEISSLTRWTGFNFNMWNDGEIEYGVDDAFYISHIKLYVEQTDDWDDNDIYSTTPLMVLKKINAIEGEEASEETYHSIYREPNQNLYVTDKEDVSNEWRLIKSTDDIDDDSLYLIVFNSNMVGFGQDSSGLTQSSLFSVEIENKKIVENAEALKDYAFNIIWDNDNEIYKIKSQWGDYIGYGGGGKNGLIISRNESNIKNITNNISFSENDVLINDYNNGAGLTYNSSSGIFKYYKSRQKNISLYKYFGGNPYSWKTLTKKEELSKVAFTGDHKDLVNKPYVGGVQVDDFETLPNPSSDYDNILARYNSSLYTVVEGPGWNFNPTYFSSKYKNVNEDNVIAHWLNTLPGSYRAQFSNTIFEFDKCNTQNTQGTGIQIGTSNNAGSMYIHTGADDYYPRWIMNDVELAFKAWNDSEIGVIHTVLGYCDTGESTIYVDKTITVDENNPEVSITISAGDNICNFLLIYTHPEEGRRAILTELKFHFLAYEKLTYNEELDDDEVVTTEYNSLREWKKISGSGDGGGGLKVIDLT